MVDHRKGDLHEFLECYFTICCIWKINTKRAHYILSLVEGPDPLLGAETERERETEREEERERGGKEGGRLRVLPPLLGAGAERESECTENQDLFL